MAADAIDALAARVEALEKRQGNPVSGASPNSSGNAGASSGLATAPGTQPPVAEASPAAHAWEPRVGDTVRVRYGSPRGGMTGKVTEVCRSPDKTSALSVALNIDGLLCAYHIRNVESLDGPASWKSRAERAEAELAARESEVKFLKSQIELADKGFRAKIEDEKEETRAWRKQAHELAALKARVKRVKYRRVTAADEDDYSQDTSDRQTAASWARGMNKLGFRRRAEVKP